MRNYTGHAWTGENYSPRLSTKEIAKRVREYCKKFKPWKFSVTSDPTQITVRLTAGPREAIKEMGYYNKRTGEFEKHENKNYSQLNHFTFMRNGYHTETNVPDGYNNGAILTEEVWEMFCDILNYLNSYHFDDSDPMIDYFDTNFYINMEIGKWDKPFKVWSR